jgi:hypothetical protein
MNSSIFEKEIEDERIETLSTFFPFLSFPSLPFNKLVLIPLLLEIPVLY